MRYLTTFSRSLTPLEVLHGSTRFISSRLPIDVFARKSPFSAASRTDRIDCRTMRSRARRSERLAIQQTKWHHPHYLCPDRHHHIPHHYINRIWASASCHRCRLCMVGRICTLSLIQKGLLHHAGIFQVVVYSLTLAFGVLCNICSTRILRSFML